MSPLLIQKVFSTDPATCQAPHSLEILLEHCLELCYLYVYLMEPYRTPSKAMDYPEHPSAHAMHKAPSTSKILAYRLNWTKFNILHKNAHFWHGISPLITATFCLISSRNQLRMQGELCLKNAHQIRCIPKYSVVKWYLEAVCGSTRL